MTTADVLWLLAYAASFVKMIPDTAASLAALIAKNEADAAYSQLHAIIPKDDFDA